ncbi:MAG: oligosaccharide flippase family protein [Solirubrobacteraceae bacterium]
MGASTVFSDVAMVTIARAGAAVLSLVTVVLATRILVPEEYANVAFATVAATLLLAASSWTGPAVPRYGREQLEAGGDMVAVTWGRVAITAPLLFGAALLLVSLKLLGALPPEFTWTYVWLALGLGGALIASEHVVLLLEAGGRMKASGLALVVRQGLTVAGLVAIVATGIGESPAFVIGLNGVAYGVVAGLFAALVWRVGIWPPALDRALLRRILSLSTPLLAFSVSQYGIAVVDIVAIRAFETPADVGVYAIAYQGYVVLQQIAAAAGPVLTPLFVSLRAGGKELVIRRYLERVVPQLILLASVAAGVAIPFIPPLVATVFGVEFEGAATPLTVLVVAVVMFFTATLFGPILTLHEETRLVALINALALTVNVVADILLIGVVGMGITGAAVATSLAIAVVAVGYFRVARNRTESVARVKPVLLAPLFAGLAASLLLSGAASIVCGVAATAISATYVVVRERPFQPADAVLVEQLDIPAPVKRLALKAISLAAR